MKMNRMILPGSVIHGVVQNTPIVSIYPIGRNLYRWLAVIGAYLKSVGDPLMRACAASQQQSQEREHQQTSCGTRLAGRDKLATCEWHHIDVGT